MMGKDKVGKDFWEKAWEGSPMGKYHGTEGLPNIMLEARACGLPLVVTDIAANQPWVRDGENGFLFSPKDYKT